MSRDRRDDAEDRPELLTPELRRRFFERLADSLAADPVELDVVEHRRRVGRLLKQRGQVDHYELLGVTAGADADEVQAAYEELARLVHPHNSGRLGSAGIAIRLDRLFDAVTEAYLTLADPERSRRYTLGLERPPRSRSAEPPEEESRRQRAEAARECYLRAREAEAEGDTFTAIQLLEQATVAAPRVEYFELLGELQARNPGWHGRALAALERAVELAPDRRDLRQRLSQLHEERGDIAGALAQREEMEGQLPPPAWSGPIWRDRPAKRGPVERLLRWLKGWLDDRLD